MTGEMITEYVDSSLLDSDSTWTNDDKETVQKLMRKVIARKSAKGVSQGAEKFIDGWWDAYLDNSTKVKPKVDAENTRYIAEIEAKFKEAKKSSQVSYLKGKINKSYRSETVNTLRSMADTQYRVALKREEVIASARKEYDYWRTEGFKRKEYDRATGEVLRETEVTPAFLSNLIGDKDFLKSQGINPTDFARRVMAGDNPESMLG
jgi:hypothetical protein